MRVAVLRGVGIGSVLFGIVAAGNRPAAATTKVIGIQSAFLGRHLRLLHNALRPNDPLVFDPGFDDQGIAGAASAPPVLDARLYRWMPRADARPTALRRTKHALRVAEVAWGTPTPASLLDRLTDRMRVAAQAASGSWQEDPALLIAGVHELRKRAYEVLGALALTAEAVETGRCGGSCTPGAGVPSGGSRRAKPWRWFNDTSTVRAVLREVLASAHDARTDPFGRLHGDVGRLLHDLLGELVASPSADLSSAERSFVAAVVRRELETGKVSPPEVTLGASAVLTIKYASGVRERWGFSRPGAGRSAGALTLGHDGTLSLAETVPVRVWVQDAEGGEVVGADLLPAKGRVLVWTGEELPTFQASERRAIYDPAAGDAREVRLRLQ